MVSPESTGQTEPSWASRLILSGNARFRCSFDRLSGQNLAIGSETGHSDIVRGMATTNGMVVIITPCISRAAGTTIPMAIRRSPFERQIG